MNYFQLAAILIPFISALMEAAEKSDEPGSNKKEVVAEQLKQSWEMFEQSGSVKEIKGVPWEAVAPIALFLIDRLASTYNLLNIFKK